MRMTTYRFNLDRLLAYEGIELSRWQCHLAHDSYRIGSFFEVAHEVRLKQTAADKAGEL
jgi:hypothetical protein